MRKNTGPLEALWQALDRGGKFRDVVVYDLPAEKAYELVAWMNANGFECSTPAGMGGGKAVTLHLKGK